MRKATRVRTALALLAALGASAAAQQAAKTPPRVIGAHQIDRHAALEHVRQALVANPNNLTDWVLLGELSQEIAADAPADTAAGYYRLARESFDNALILEPNNAHYKAAAQFARTQEKAADQIQKSRSLATSTYLEARRRELAQSANTPTVRVYPAPAQPEATTYAPTYQTYVNQEGNPYTFEQHYDMFYGPIHRRYAGQEITATERAALVKPGSRFAPP